MSCTLWYLVVDSCDNSEFIKRAFCYRAYGANNSYVIGAGN